MLTGGDADRRSCSLMLMLMMLMLSRIIGLRPDDRWPCGVLECPKNQKPGRGQVLVGVIRRPGREAGTQARDSRAGFSIGAPGDGGVTFHGTGFQLPGRNDEGNGDVAFPHRWRSGRGWGAAAGG